MDRPNQNDFSTISDACHFDCSKRTVPATIPVFLIMTVNIVPNRTLQNVLRRFQKSPKKIVLSGRDLDLSQNRSSSNDFRIYCDLRCVRDDSAGTFKIRAKFLIQIRRISFQAKRVCKQAVFLCRPCQLQLQYIQHTWCFLASCMYESRFLLLCIYRYQLNIFYMAEKTHEEEMRRNVCEKVHCLFLI